MGQKTDEDKPKTTTNKIILFVIWCCGVLAYLKWYLHVDLKPLREIIGWIVFAVVVGYAVGMLLKWTGILRAGVMESLRRFFNWLGGVIVGIMESPFTWIFIAIATLAIWIFTKDLAK